MLVGMEGEASTITNARWGSQLMGINNFKFPTIGLRNIKTALGVFLCVLVYDLFQRPYPFFACIAVVICLKDTMGSSFEMGKNRLIGTFIGGLVGTPFLMLKNLVSEQVNFFAVGAIMIGLGIVLVIYLCNLIGKIEVMTSTACIVFLSVVVNLRDTMQYLAPHIYSINRMIDSTVGIIIALIINKYFFPLDQNKTEERESSAAQVK